MFKQVHKTIKTIAIISAILGGLAIPAGIIIDASIWGDGVLFGIISGSGLVLIVQSWLVYGFGQLIENSQHTADLLAKQIREREQHETSMVQPDELPSL